MAARGTVFLAGAGGMALEVLAARMVHPVFGSSVYVWGALLTVFLSGLAVGYRAGGGRARRGAGMGTAVAVLIGAALYTAAALLAGEAALDLLSSPPLPFTLQSLPALALLFGPPSVLVGYVSPLVAETVERGAGAGHAAGTVYGWGTAGSIAGASGAAFLLLPLLGLDLSLVGVSLLFLAAAGLAASLAATRLRTRIPALLLPAILVLAAGLVATSGAPAAETGPVLHQEETLYHSIEVVERGGVRTLKLNGDRHSAEYVDGRQGYVFRYTPRMHLPLLYRDRGGVDRVLAIGGGAGSVPRRYAEMYGAEVDVVEIDPAVARVAERYFDADRPGVNWVTMDGRRYLRTTEKTYDVVLLDAYRAGGVPEHLATQEFMEEVKRHLEPGGVVASNMIGTRSGDASRLWRAEHKTLDATFGDVDAYPSRPGSLFTQNFVLVAHAGPEPSEEQLRSRAETRDTGIDLAPFLDDRIPDPDTDDLPVLRDDGGAVDRFSRAVAGSELPSLDTGSEPFE